jgi:hypothetical protein
MRYRLRLLPLGLALGLIVAAAPASAANTLLHKRTSVAASVGQLDSTLWTLTTAISGALPGRDTLGTVNGTIGTDAFVSSSPIDSLSDRGALSAGRGFPHNLWVTVEVTGALQSIDTLYAYVQYSQGQVPPNTGQTNTYTAATLGDPNSYVANWRWYDGVGITNASVLTGGLVALVNNTGSNTFVFPIPCAASDKNTWLAASNLRIILVSDTNTAAVGLSTRAWLTWRNQ